MPYIRAVAMMVWTLTWTAIGIVLLVLHPGGALYFLFARIGWARQVMWLSGCEITVKGAENIDWSKHFIICANHTSQLDILLLYSRLPANIRFLAKRSLFFIPIFGWSLWLARFVPVDRGSKAKARASIDRAVARIRKGPSLVVFPEGTRSDNGLVQRFKSGAFVLAIRAGVPILPVAIRGTFEVLPKTRLGVHPGPIELVVGQPIVVDNLGLDDKENLRRATEAAVIAMRDSGEPRTAVEASSASLLAAQQAWQS